MSNTTVIIVGAGIGKNGVEEHESNLEKRHDLMNFLLVTQLESHRERNC